MAISVTISAGSITKQRNSRYLVSVNLLIEDGETELYNSPVSVRWNGSASMNSIRAHLKNALQDVVDEVVESQETIDSSDYTDMITWLNNNVSP